MNMMSDRRFSAFLVAGISAAVSILWLWPLWESRQSRDTPSAETPEKVAESPPFDHPEPSHPNERTLATELWEKIVSATRDTNEHENMTKINFDQWNLALDKYCVVCEPGLSRKIFKSMSSSAKKKEITMREFVTHVQTILSDEATYKQRADMNSQQIVEIVRLADSPNLFTIVLFSKIVFSLLNDKDLNVEALLKETFEITSEMSTNDLLSRLDDPNWENRVTILKHLQESLQTGRSTLCLRVLESDSDDSACSSSSPSDVSPMMFLRGWMDQFPDQRSQLVRHALETFPDIVECVMKMAGNRQTDVIDFQEVFEALFVPIRAKRSTKIQEWAHECCAKVVDVVLNRGGKDDKSELDDDGDVEEEKGNAPCAEIDGSRVGDLVKMFCVDFTQNSKYGRVRERSVSYLKLVIEFYHTNGNLSFLLGDELTAGRIVEALNHALLDKKSEVRAAAFDLMKNVTQMNSDIVRDTVLAKIDDKARARYTRSTKGSSKKKRRPERRRGSSATIAEYRRRMRVNKGPGSAPNRHNICG